ncbi:MAG: hypothetical protein NTZ13_03365 [Candidatus Parcubacteria bacterium]|nr:hypothetical protein [Candidatus Parcubacteria bacterium]
MQEDIKHEWETYCKRELEIVRTILSEFGFTLEERQPHLGGERYLMQAITTESGKKLILVGRRKDGTRVIIKTTEQISGMREILRERKCRHALKKMKFAYHVFFSPEEILFVKKAGRMIFIQKFIEQDCSFLERTNAEQFRLLLKSFKAQEGARAATYEHFRFARKNFGSIDAEGYLKSFDEFKNKINDRMKDAALEKTLLRAREFLSREKYTIEQYSGFLTHVDFVPHNIRIVGENIYLLDSSALRFGNKYEGWARCINFMALYNPAIEQALIQYVRDNRTEEETLSLRLMRVYRLGEIIWYYVNTLSKSSGNLLVLNKARILFWTHVLEAVLDDKLIPREALENYKNTRDRLRTEDEKDRQRGLH